jgi:ABC-type transporter Mla maintaining outer membrane lipid asymmetry ATPase subunit MlaF
VNEEITLEQVTERAIRMTDRMLAELERRMDAPAKDGIEAGLQHKTAGQYKSLGTDLTKVTRALTGMLREARAQKKDAYALFKKMTLAERNEAVLNHVRTHLSPDRKRELVQQLLADVNLERRE